MTRDAMLSAIDQAQTASLDKATSNNQKYQQLTGMDHPTFTNILKTINGTNPIYSAANNSLTPNSSTPSTTSNTSTNPNPNAPSLNSIW